MFPLTHIATAEVVLGKENIMTVLGSMFPDFVSYLGIGRNVGHELGRDLYRYCLRYYPRCVDFALGVLTHGTSLPGIDFYADEEYAGKRPGFCFQQGEKIASAVEKICHVPPSMALWKSHNFMEIAFDIITATRQKDLEQRAKDYIFRDDIPVVKMLEDYLQVSEKNIRDMFRVVPEHFCFDGEDIELMTAKFLQSLKRRHGITGGNLAEATTITREALEIIEPQYDGFMSQVLPLIERDIGAFSTAPGAVPPEG
ncbi:MAG: hypothetical protein Q4C00_01570 [Bacillota bacterium]|nr:hypothetical protein [Bacillota bacterium]